ncbi:MAG: SWIM zinc finger family protein [Thermofilum sp.]|uniref:SWIM-type domain-containing protein n=1 Tax=Thermofilum pendens TaxID=2269 RepID=A0A7C4H874_THEPE
MVHADELKARKALLAGRVKRIRLCDPTPRDTPLFAVLSAGRTYHHVVVPGRYCSCPDFLFSVVIRRVKEKCYHMLAVEKALRSGIAIEEECWTAEKLARELLKAMGGRL